MEKVYSFKKGLYKGLLSLLSIVAAIVTLAGFADVGVWDLVVNNVKPLLGSLTVGGLMTIIINYVKFKLTA